MTKTNYAEKKAKERAKKRDAGYKEISIWVAPEQHEALRQYADSLPKPQKKENPDQKTIFDLIGQSNG